MKPPVKYSRTQNLLVVIPGYILGAFATFWTIFLPGNAIPLLVKIIGGSIYFVLLCLACIFVFTRRGFGVEGLVRIHKDSNYLEITRQFYKAEHSIEIIVYHGNNLLRCTKEGLINALKRDVDVKLLIAGDDSVLLKETWNLEGADNKNNDRNKAWITINEIKTEAKSKTCSLRYYKYNTQARYALIIVDGNWAWWTPYHPGIDVPETSSFVLVNTGKRSIIQECKKHFRTLWLNLEQEQGYLNPLTLPSKKQLEQQEN